MSHLIKIYAVCKSSYFYLWYFKELSKYLCLLRKICKHCRCGPEDHDLTDEDDRDKQPTKPLFENHYDNVRDLSSRLHKLNIDDPAVQSEIVTPENDIIIHRIIAENLVS